MVRQSQNKSLLSFNPIAFFSFLNPKRFKADYQFNLSERQKYTELLIQFAEDNGIVVKKSFFDQLRLEIREGDHIDQEAATLFYFFTELVAPLRGLTTDEIFFFKKAFDSDQFSEKTLSNLMWLKQSVRRCLSLLAVGTTSLMLWTNYPKISFAYEMLHATRSLNLARIEQVQESRGKEALFHERLQSRIDGYRYYLENLGDGHTFDPQPGNADQAWLDRQIQDLSSTFPGINIQASWK